jgi:hypothetical protein
MRAWEPEFIRHWEVGKTTDQIAAALGIAEGTARSRAYTLQQEGKIQPRPKGGKRVRPTSADSTLQRPVQKHDTAPVQSSAESTLAEAPRSQAMAIADVYMARKAREEITAELMTEIRDALHALPDQVASRLRSALPASAEPTPVQITALPPYPKGKAVRWNLWILDVIRDELTTLAAERGLSPSQFVQELLWKALTARRASMP